MRWIVVTGSCSVEVCLLSGEEVESLVLKWATWGRQSR